MSKQTRPRAHTELIVCPRCDAAYQVARPAHDQRAVCQRCDAVLINPRRKAGVQIVAISCAIVILLLAAAVFPFLSVHAGGVQNSVSVLETALAFRDGWLVMLSLVMVFLIFIIPLLRVVLSIYVIAPMVFDRPAAPHAAHVFRLAEALRPWSMAEIFAIGCAVALIKISALVDVSFGPAFWMFAVLVVLVVVQDGIICRWSVWNALSKNQKS